MNTNSIKRFYTETDWMFRVLALLRGSTAMHAGLWQRGVHSHAAALTALNRALAARATLRSGQRVLDAGCGVGSCALWLARKYAVEVLGVTLLPHQALQAQQAAQKAGLHPRVRFVCLDYAHSGLQDGIFDLVWAVESFCHAAEGGLFLQEAARLLRPGGRIIIADRFRSEQSADVRGEQLLQQWYTGWAFPGLWKLDEVVAATRAAGFRNVGAEEVTVQMWPSLRFLGQFAAASLPAALLLHGLGLQSPPQVAAIRGCIAQYATLKRGLWGYWFVHGQR
jgi:cyclopropane fatty-acyl-phospholipid synthase-like methyltransferase